MNMPQQDNKNTRLLIALSAADSSTRLQAAMAAGTHPEPGLIRALVERCAVEPDFFVRDMLTWALLRHPEDLTVPKLLTELHSETPQARSQALHTVSKIGDRTLWPKVPKSLIHDSDDQVARTAWRTAVVLVPPGHEAELAADLSTELGRGDRDIQLSLSRALIAFGDTVAPILQTAASSANPRVRAHAQATERLLEDPESEFILIADDARRIVNGGSALQDDL